MGYFPVLQIILSIILLLDIIEKGRMITRGTVIQGLVQ